ncbi:MAG: hypothetical protein ACJ764_03695 [Solirubrobacteraceae bacterium]
MAASVGDKVRQTARTYTSLDLVTREFDRLEQRGSRALSRRQRALTRQRRGIQRDARQAQRAVERQVDGLRSDAQDFAGQVRQLV